MYLHERNKIEARFFSRRSQWNNIFLVSVFKSLLLSHLRYSSTILVACPDGTKSDMQVLQNTLLRTIGITGDLAKSKYGILDVSEFVSKTSLEQVICILTTDGKEPSGHRLSASIRSSTRSHFPFSIPLCKPKFDRNAVIRALVGEDVFRIWFFGEKKIFFI